MRIYVLHHETIKSMTHAIRRWEEDKETTVAQLLDQKQNTFESGEECLLEYMIESMQAFHDKLRPSH
jgi:hypothetical protein